MMRGISILFILFIAISAHATILEQTPVTKTVTISDGPGNLQLQIDYSKGWK